MRLLIDISGLAHRAAHKLSLSDRNGTPTNVTFGVLRSLQHLAEQIEPEEMIVCWDSGHVARSRLYPEYKLNRKRDEEWKKDFDRQMGVLREVLSLLPIVSVSEDGVEADDCIAALCEFMSPEDIGVVTGDRDLYQLHGGGTGTHVLLDYDGVPARLEFKPSQYVTYKVLVGDSSDNIKGVLGLGDVKARKLLAEYGTLRDIMRAALKRRDEKFLGRMTYEEALPIVQRNLKLIRLKGTPTLTKEQRTRIISSYRTARLHRQTQDARLRQRLMDLGFKSILRRFSGFVLTFKGMERMSTRRTVEAANETEQAVHQTDQEGRRQWRKIRRIATGADGDHHRGREATATQIRRVRRVVVRNNPQPGGRWRRVRRVVGAQRRARGGEPGDEGGGEGHPPGLRDREHGQPAELAAQDGHPRDAGAVSAVIRKARESRARRGDQAVSGLPAPLQPESVRRDSTLSVLSSLNDGDTAWLKRRSNTDLERLAVIIRGYEADETYSPSKADADFVAELAYERGMEMPDWMLTEQEAKQAAVRVADMDVEDLASRAIAGMGRRR